MNALKRTIGAFLLIPFVFSEGGIDCFAQVTQAKQTEKDRVITGTVIDNVSGEPLVGASVLLKGTTVRSFTDVDGKFSINAGKELSP